MAKAPTIKRHPTGRLMLIVMLFLLCFVALTVFFFTEHFQGWDAAIIPLDSRPVNTDLPVQLAAIGGIRAVLPDASLLDQFLTPSQPEPLLAWLNSVGSKSPLLIINLNELIYGSLLNSREVIQYENSAEKLNQVEAFLRQQASGQKNSRQSIQLIYILPRLLVSQYDLTMWAYEKELSEYSQIKHQLDLSPKDENLSQRLLLLEDTIPREILQKYDMLYKEASMAGQRLLIWLEQDLVDEVIIGLDDAAPYGLNVQAFHLLEDEAKQRNLSQAFFLHGADELTPLVLARHSLNLDKPADFQCLYLTPEDAANVFPYEAISLQENIAEKLAYLYSPKATAASKHTLLQKLGSFLNGQLQPALNASKTLILNTSQSMSEAAMDQAWAGMSELTGYVGLADAAKTNGAYVPFIDRVGLEQVYQYVDCYAGWNTAGNSLGTVMAHLLFYEQSRHLPFWSNNQALAAHETLQKIRLIDDYIYQSQVRSEFTSWALGNGFHYLSFGQRWPEANAKLQEMMQEALKPYPSLQSLPAKDSVPSFSFPWPRSFEIKIE